MAHIKCRYREYYCSGFLNGYDYFNEECWNDYGEKHSSCPHFETRKDKNGQKVYCSQCIHISALAKEFEKNVKRYNLALYGNDPNRSGFLEITGLIIDEQNIDYLEIDGRILIDDVTEGLRHDT